MTPCSLVRGSQSCRRTHRQEGGNVFLWHADSPDTNTASQATAQQTTIHQQHKLCSFVPPPLYTHTIPRAPYWNSVYWTTTYVNNCMQHNPSWEADSSPASQEIHRILRKPEVHYHLPQIPPLVPHLSQISPRTNPICLRTTLILSSHLRIGLQSSLFPSVFPNKTL